MFADCVYWVAGKQSLERVLVDGLHRIMQQKEFDRMVFAGTKNSGEVAKN